jgi:hypothetical protein
VTPVDLLVWVSVLLLVLVGPPALSASVAKWRAAHRPPPSPPRSTVLRLVPPPPARFVFVDALGRRLDRKRLRRPGPRRVRLIDARPLARQQVKDALEASTAGEGPYRRWRPEVIRGRTPPE